MRALGYIAICAATLAVAGCQSETESPSFAGRVTGLRLSLEQTGASKTSLLYDSEENALKCSWLTTDKVWVSDLVSTAQFSLPEEVEEATSADFQGNLDISSSASSLYAIYPYASASLSGGSAVVTLPTTQNAEDSGQYDLKAGGTTIIDGQSYQSLTIPLRNLTGILRVKLKIPSSLGGKDFSEEELKSLSLTSSIPVAGQAGVQLSEGQIRTGAFSSNSLSYTFPAGTSAAATNEFILFISPGNYTSNSIVWTAETTSYSIHFKLSPGMDIENGYFYNATFNLGATAWNIVTSAPYSERDCFVEGKADPVIKKTAVTPTTGSISWSEPASQTYRKYNIQLLADASANTVLREYLVKIKSGDKAAFTFGGLDPQTTYYARVQGAQRGGNNTNWSQAVAFTTDPAVAYDSETTVASADFDMCPWGGDYMHLAISTRPQTDAQSSLSAGWSKCYSNIIIDTPASYTGFSRLAGSFDPNYASMLSELGLDGWTFSNVYMRPGYAQVGNTSTATLTSPALTALGSGLHTVGVAFKAVPFTSSGSKSGSVIVTCSSSSGSVIGTQTLSLAQTPDIPSAMPQWESFAISFENVPSGSKIQFSNGGTSNDFCIDEIHIYSDDALPPIVHTSGNVYGLVADTSGNPISGVVVSDGYVVTTTNAQGVYEFTSQKANGYVFISQPQGYEVALDGVFPQFWQALESSSTAVEERHDFRLTPVSNNDCVILALGDFHLCNRNALYDLQQFRMEAQELKSTVQSLQAQGKKVYGLTLGDMTWDIYWDNSSGYGGVNFDLAAYRSEVNADFANVNFPIWHTIGNHDHAYYYTGDWDTVVPYKQIIGPTYYSFNVAGYHIISMDNVICENDGTSGGRDDHAGLTDAILSWLQADMAQVPSSMPVIVSMHEQAYSPSATSSMTSTSCSEESYAASMINAIGSSRNIHIVTGHTHNINNAVKSAKIYEHNAGALCATWWWTGRFCITSEATWGGGTSLSDTYHIARDGTPAGYTIYNLSSGTMTWQYKGFGLPVSRQFKTYDRNQFTLTAANWCPNASSSNKTAFENLAAKQPDYSYAKAAGESLGFLQGSVPNNLVYINVWNWDPSWTISVREGSNTLTVTKLQDAYDPMHIVAYPAVRYNSGNGTTSTFVTKATQHIFRVQASSASSTLTITVTDRFGNTYTETMARPKAFGVNWN